jgi:phenylacetate-CoA ligase
LLNWLAGYLLYPLVERLQGRRIRSKRTALRRLLALPFDQRRQWARQRLACVLSEAGRHVPYYRDLFRRLRFDPTRVAGDEEYLQELPFLDKSILREQGERLLHEGLPRERLHLRKTGGSTGPSAHIYYSAEALDWTAAANLLVLHSAGKRPHTREAHLSTHFPETFPWCDRLKEWIKTAALNRVNLATDTLDDAGLARLTERLRRARIHLIQGHPSTLHALARYAERQPAGGRGLFRIFESTGETLAPETRALIERVFGCRVVNRYGSAEFGVVAYENQTSPQGLQVLDPLVWPEATAGDGGTELVFTGLLNPAMPLIRYRTGDLGDLIVRSDGWWLQELHGRIHDLVRVGDAVYPTHYFQDVLDRIGGVDEFQLEARTGAPPLLRIVPTAEADHDALVLRLREFWGDRLTPALVGFAELRRDGWRSKFRHVVGPPGSAVA